MGKIFTIAKREYMERVRSKWFIIATVFGPLLFGAIMILPAALAARTEASREVANVAILDGTGTELGRRIGDRLSGGLSGDTSLTRVVTVNPSTLAEAESTATRDVVAERLQGYLVVDSQSLAGISARYAGRNASSISDLERIRTSVRQSVLALQLEREGLDPQRAEALTTSRLLLDSERLSESGRGGSGIVNVFFGIGVATLLYFCIFVFGYNVLRGVQEEKQTRVAEVVLSSAPADALLAGKVAGIGAVGLTQILIWIVSGLLLLQIRGPVLEALGAEAITFQLPSISVGVLALLLLFFVLGYVLYASLFAAVGAMVNSDQEAQQAMQPITLLLVSSVLFFSPVMQNPNSRLAEVVSWIPFTAPVMMPLRLSLTSIPPLELTLVLAGIFLTCVATVWVAARIYRVGLLMYGKRPTLREIGRWVRAS